MGAHAQKEIARPIDKKKGLFSLEPSPRSDRAPSKQPLQALVDSLTDYGVFVLDPNGVVQTWNAGAQRIKGYSADEIIGRHFSIFYPPEDVQRGKPQNELEVVRTAGRLEDEGWRARKDGSRFWAHVVMTALFDEAGDLRGFGKVIRDLTERRRIEETLRASELQSRALIEKAIDGVLIADDDRQLLEANPAACELLGLEREQALGRRLDEFLVGTPAHSVEDRWREFITNRWYRGEWQLRRPDGEVRDIEVSSVADFVPGRHLATMRDVTKSRRDKAALHVRVQQQAAVAEFGHRALAGEDLEVLLRRAVETLRELLETELTAATELVTDGSGLLVHAACGWREVVGRKMNASEKFQAGYCLARGEPVILEDLATETRFSGPPLFHAHNVISGISVPIPGRDRPFGTLCAHTRSKRLFTQDDINFVQSLANILATAIERKRVEAEIDAQQAAIRELSTPVLKVRERMLILPMIGHIDAQRARQLSDQLLAGIRLNRARVVVIDITGVGAMDANAANSLVRAAEAARLLGAQVIVTGISTDVARTLCTLPVDLSALITLADLQSGIEKAEHMLEWRAASDKRETAA